MMAILELERENKFDYDAPLREALAQPGGFDASLRQLPNDDAYTENVRYQNDALSASLFTKQELDEIDAKGPMGWVETRQKKYVNWLDIVPFAGTGARAAEAAKLLSLSKKIENGEEVSDADKSFVYENLRKQVEISRRGTNWGSKLATGLVMAPAFIGEFAITGGLGSAAAKGAIKAAGYGATKAAIKAGTKIAASKAGALALGTQAGKAVGTKAALDVSAKIVGGFAGREAILVPEMAWENYGERKISDGLKVTDKGDIIFDAPDGFDATTAWKALGTAQIEITSESLGGITGRAANKVISRIASTEAGQAIGAVAASVYNKIPKEARVKLEAVGRILNTKTEAAGFHGVAEEMTEERIGDLLKVAFDLDEEQGYNTDQFLHAIIPDAQQWMLEAGLFSITGAGLAGVNSFAKKTVHAELVNNQGKTPDEAEIVVNSLSETENEDWANKIIAEPVMLNPDLSEKEVKDMEVQIEQKIQRAKEIRQQRATGEYLEPTPEEKEARKQQEIKSVKAEIVNLGVNEDLAHADADMQVNIIEHIADKAGIDYETVEALMPLKYKRADQSMQEELPAIQLNEDGSVVYNQSAAMKKSSFENFDDFYNDTLSKEKNTSDKEQFNGSTADGVYYRVPHDTVVHSVNKHSLSAEQWNNVLNNLDTPQAYVIGNKTRFGGKPVLIKVKSGDKYYGVVLETFEKNNPMITTAFQDTSKKIDAWMKNETQGTKKRLSRAVVNTNFAGNHLNNIITDIQPDYKPFYVNSTPKFQTAPVTDTKAFKDWFGDSKVVDDNNITVTPVEIKSDGVPEFKKVSELKNWLHENLPLLGDITIKSNGREIQFSKGSIGRSLKGTNRGEVKRQSYSGLREIVENAVYGAQRKVDVKHAKKVKGQELYYNAITYKGDLYGVEIAVDIPKNENSKHNYAGHKIAEIKITPAINVLTSQEKVSDATGVTNISITDIIKNFNPNNKTKDLLNPEKFELISNRIASLNQSINDNVNNVKGSIELGQKDAIISLFQNSDESTVLHELGHFYLEMLQRVSTLPDVSPEILEDIQAVREFTGNTGGAFTTEQHEMFAEAFEVYSLTGSTTSVRVNHIYVCEGFFCRQQSSENNY